MSEIVRAGIISVDHGQTEAAQALGMTRTRVMRRIVLPQAMRVILPPTGNETISMLKTSSLASIATVGELFYVQEQISNANFDIVELLVVASIWYLVMTSILTFGQYYLERYFARGSARQLPLTPLQRFRRTFFRSHVPPQMGGRTGAHLPSPPASGVADERADGPCRELSTSALAVSRCCAVSTSRWRRVRSCASWGRPDPARARFFAASIISRRSTPGRLSVDGELVGYREHGGKIYELPDTRGLP